MDPPIPFGNPNPYRREDTNDELGGRGFGISQRVRRQGGQASSHSAAFVRLLLPWLAEIFLAVVTVSNC